MITDTRKLRGSSRSRKSLLTLFAITLYVSAISFASDPQIDTRTECPEGFPGELSKALEKHPSAGSDSSRPLTYDEYLKFKSEHIDRFDHVDFTQFDPIVSRFYHENYKGKSILIFADDDMSQSSGVAVVMRNLKERLEEKSGLKVVFVTPSMFKKHIDFKFQGQVFHQALPTDREIAELVRKYDPAAIHVMAELAVGTKARASLIKRKIPFTTAYHTEWPTFTSVRLPSVLKSVRPIVEGLVYKYLRWFHGKSKGIMVPSRSILEKLVAARFKKEQLRPWSHGVDLELFRPELRDETLYPKLAQLQGREAKPPYVIMVSRLAAEKNVESFLKTKIDAGTKFFIGPGPAGDVARFKRLYPDVIFLGAKDYRTELPALYASADAFVFPGTRETLGLVNGEALATGTPVVAYNVQGPKDVITDPKAGILVHYDPDHPDENIRRLSDAIPQALKLDRQDVRRYAEGLSWNYSVSEFLDFLYPLTPDHLAAFKSAGK